MSKQILVGEKYKHAPTHTHTHARTHARARARVCTHTYTRMRKEPASKLLNKVYGNRKLNSCMNEMFCRAQRTRQRSVNVLTELKTVYIYIHNIYINNKKQRSIQTNGQKAHKNNNNDYNNKKSGKRKKRRKDKRCIAPGILVCWPE